MPLPNFIIIGTMKAGTTSLHSYLDSHPDIRMSESKELDFFVEEKNWGQGLDWYKSQFKASSNTIYGESSPNYTKSHAFPGVPKRIFEVLPDVKLIYLLRDPIERIVSHHSHQWIDQNETQPINCAFDNLTDNHYVETSRYGQQLQEFLNHFPGDQILTLSSQKLQSDRTPTLQTIFKFLGVDIDHHSDSWEENKHQTSHKKMRPAWAKAIGQSSWKNRIRPLIPSALLRAYISKTESEPTLETLSQENRDRLDCYFSEDTKLLQDCVAKCHLDSQMP